MEKYAMLWLTLSIKILDMWCDSQNDEWKKLKVLACLLCMRGSIFLSACCTFAIV